MTESYGQNCNKCGFCLSVCPTYKAQGTEDASPRARIQLIDALREDRVGSSEKLKEIISKCLMCGSCANICPSGINHYDRFMRMREQMIEDHGDSVEIKSLVYLLARESRIRMAAGAARVAQKLVPDAFARKYRLGNIQLKRFPSFNKVPFRQAAQKILKGVSPAVNPLSDTLKYGRILYFTGCATNYLFDDTGFATLKILKNLGVDVVIPESQTCCGIPMIFHGGRLRAKANIKTNLDCLDVTGFDALIVDCPTCGAALKNEYPALAEELGLDQTRANQIAEKVVDISTFLISHGVQNAFPDRTEPVSVTYHQPCHLKNNMPHPSSSQALLKALPGVEYIPASDFNVCCGGGGTFFYEYPDLSKGMVTQKIANANATKARFWVTDCPVCRINLGGNLEETSSLTVVHPALLAAGGLTSLGQE